MTDFSQGERLQLAYLEAEFACIDLLLRREVRRWEIAGQDPNDDYRGLYITQVEAIQLLDLPFGVSWGQSIELAPEEEAAFKEALAQARHTADQLAGTFTKEKITPRLLQVASAFGLDRTELDILLLCLAPAFATRYERVYGYLQDNVTRRRPTVRLILQLLGEAGMAQYALAHYLSQDAPLFRHRLLEYVVEAPPANVHWINQTLQVDEGVVAWLRGEYQAHSLLGEFAKLQQRFEKGLKGKQDAERLDCIPTGTVGTRSEPVWIFYGVDSERQQVVAEQMAAEAGQSLLTVQLNKVVNESCPPLQAVRLALRDARLTGSIPLLSGWDACLSSEDTVEQTVLRELCAHSGMVVVAGQRRWQPGGVSRQRPFFQRVFELPKYEERFALWQHYLEMQEHTVTLSELSELAAQSTLSSRQISDAIAAARDNALQRGRDTTIDELYASARSYSNPRLTTYARKITPRFGWDDIILPADEREKL